MTDIPGSEGMPESDQDKKTANEALKKALDLLSRRDHALAELRLKLITRDFEGTVIDGVLAYLVDKNYLNDARFAEAFVRMRSGKGFGERDIQAKLRERKICPEDAAAAFANNAIDWFELAERVLDKKFGGEFPREKAARYLQSRGFTAEQTFQAMDAVVQKNKTI